MANHEQITPLIKLGREQRFLEYKRSLPWNELKESIAKTALGMANIRDGGIIIIGMAKQDDVYVQEGMSAEHLETYVADDVQAFINRFADPYLRIELHRVEFESKNFLAIVVNEFDEIPIVCKLDSAQLRQGAIYTRANRIPETSEVRSQTEMREIIELAVDKGVRSFIQRIHKIGIPLEEVAQKSNSALFNEEREGL